MRFLTVEEDEGPWKRRDAFGVDGEMELSLLAVVQVVRRDMTLRGSSSSSSLSKAMERRERRLMKGFLAVDFVTGECLAFGVELIRGDSFAGGNVSTSGDFNGGGLTGGDVASGGGGRLALLPLRALFAANMPPEPEAWGSFSGALTDLSTSSPAAVVFPGCSSR